MAENKKILTDDMMQTLLGDNYQGALYYNFDLGQWNRDSYMGIDLNMANSVATPWVKTAKEILESTPDFKRWQVVALVTMMVEGFDYKGFAKTISNPKNRARGNALVSTIVRRSKKTGEIRPLSQAWLGTGHFIYPEYAVRAMSLDFPRGICSNGVLRGALIKTCTKKR